jgi:Na+/H+-dicarboxylate symporter
MSFMRFPRLPLYVQVIIGVVLGSVLGVVFKREPIVLGIGNDELGGLGMLVIRLLKALAVPLVLFAILDAFVRTRISARSGLKLLLICLINVSVAFAIGLTLMNVLKPGAGSAERMAELKGKPNKEAEASVAIGAKGSISPLKAIDSYVPESLVDPFQKNSIIPVVLIGLILGAAMRRLKDAGDGVHFGPIESFIHGGFQILVQVLAWIVKLVPFAVFAVVAQVVGKAGLGVFSALFPFLGIVLLGMALHSLLYYPAVAWFVGGKTPRVYLGKGADAILMALSTNSSLATVPVTLKCLTEKMGVSVGSARLAACIGTNLNNDGITLYEAMAALFVAQALGMDLTLGQQVVVVLASVMAGVGIAGIPEAGLVMLPLVLGAMGLPTELVAVAIAFVLPVDWILARARSAVNVMSDMLVAILLDRGAPVPLEEPQSVPAK